MDLTKKSWQWIMLIALSVIWGSSFILMKKGLESFDYMQVGAMRMFFAFIFFIPFIIKRIKKLNRKNILPILVVGFIGNAIPSVLFTKAEIHLDSSIAGMLNSTVPLFVWIIGIIFYKNKTKLFNVIGLLIGLIGTLGIIITDFSNILGNFNVYAIYVIIATLFYGINTNVVKYQLNDLDGISITSLAFLLVGPPSGLYLLFSDFSGALASPVFYNSLFYIIILAFFSSFIAVALFNILIKHTTTIFAASVTYLIPIAAIGFGLFAGEIITIYQLISMGIVLSGVYLINKK